MREIFYGRADLSNQVGRPMTCEYHILVRTVPPPVSCESYGVSVALLETAERAAVADITVLPARIEALAGLLVAGGVTPCTLKEIVEDWL